MVDTEGCTRSEQRRNSRDGLVVSNKREMVGANSMYADIEELMSCQHIFRLTYVKQFSAFNFKCLMSNSDDSLGRFSRSTTHLPPRTLTLTVYLIETKKVHRLLLLDEATQNRDLGQQRRQNA